MHRNEELGLIPFVLFLPILLRSQFLSISVLSPSSTNCSPSPAPLMSVVRYSARLCFTVQPRARIRHIFSAPLTFRSSVRFPALLSVVALPLLFFLSFFFLLRICLNIGPKYRQHSRIFPNYFGFYLTRLLKYWTKTQTDRQVSGIRATIDSS